MRKWAKLCAVGNKFGALDKEGNVVKMRQNKFLLFFRLGTLLLLVLTLGCSSIREGMRTEGQPISKWTDRWGSPSQVTSDGKGGNVYIWEIWHFYGYGNFKLERNIFWVDSNGIIYKWTTRSTGYIYKWGSKDRPG
jgi:hypothetical protein